MSQGKFRRIGERHRDHADNNVITPPSDISNSASSVPGQVSVLHSSEAGEHVNHMVAPPQYMQVVHHPSLIHDLYPSHSSGKTHMLHFNVFSLFLSSLH